MKIVLLILGIIILAVLFVVFFPLRVVFEYTDKAKFKVYAYGIKIYDSQKPRTEEQKKPLPQSEESNSGNDLVERLKKNFGFLKEILKLIVEKAKKYAIIKNIEVRYRFGLSDAAVTGIYSGVVYGVVNGFAAFLRNYFRIKNQKIDVIPDFDNKVQEFEAKIELIVRVVFFVPVMHKVIKLVHEKKEV
ncbi:MAG: DUF2953 domain-containing protein [Clostridia bacterium]|nr:DUF2953 domain-containing protein [Clostridia bacterium]